MKINAVIILFLLCIQESLFAQYSRHIIEFTDKKGSSFSISDPSAYLSQRAIDRRNRYHIAIDQTDLPISPSYLDSIRSIPNVIILNVSKWLNQVLIKTSDNAALNRINNYPFVKRLSPIANIVRPQGPELVNARFAETISPLPHRQLTSGIRQASGASDMISYGNSFDQVHIHNGEFLHNLGFTGAGMVIAFLDAGFNHYDTNPAFDSLRLQNRILGGYDFVKNIPGVSSADMHGAYCLSTIAANIPGQMVGTAPAASFWLFRTEDAATEFPVEEQNWAAAAERADSAGADMISSSLGYTSFDDASFNHTYSDRNGNTCISTRAADLAAAKGMIVMNSAGNNGGFSTEEKYISCPADGDSVIAVGAITHDGAIAGFSSWGPSASGKIKPNLVSIGQGTIVADRNGTPIAGNGTSFSNPNLAGLMACLWQAFPEFSNMEIIDAVQKSADRFSHPDGRYGYGIPNFRIAYELLEKARIVRKASATLGVKWIKALPVPFHSGLQVLWKAPITAKATLRVFNSVGQVLETQTIETIQNQFYAVQISKLDYLSKGVYFIQYNDPENSETIRVVKIDY